MTEFALKNWKLLLTGVVIALLGLKIALLSGELRHGKAELAQERAASALFAARVTAQAERIRAAMAERALAVARDQTRITEEVSDDYEKRIADLNRRADALRLQFGARRADPGGAGRPAGLPVLPQPAGGPDAAAGDPGFPAVGAHGGDLEWRITATEQAIRLEALQAWVRRQAAADAPPTN